MRSRLLAGSSRIEDLRRDLRPKPGGGERRSPMVAESPTRRAGFVEAAAIRLQERSEMQAPRRLA